MLKAIDVANFFVDLTNHNEEDYITNLKLDKLLYFSQGLSLSRTGKPLFEEEIEAWKYGPVVPSVYRTFKGCGNRPISSTTENYDFSKISEEDLDVLFDVARVYGSYTAPALVRITHADGTPWKEVYQENERQTVIPKDKIKKYFKNKKGYKLFDDKYFDGIEPVGKRDEHGYLVLPQEFNDE